MIEVVEYRDPWLSEKVNDIIGFYPREFYCLDNFSSFKVEYNGYIYSTAEEAYQAAKFDTVALDCRNLLRRYYFENKSAYFEMARPKPSVEQILDFGIGKQNGYARVLHYEKINNSERTRKCLVYFLNKYAGMNNKQIAETLKIEVDIVPEDLKRHPLSPDEQDKGLLELYEDFLLRWRENYYHTENNNEWI